MRADPALVSLSSIDDYSWTIGLEQDERIFIAPTELSLYIRLLLLHSTIILVYSSLNFESKYF